jgi:hypothetical protein
MQKYLIVEFTNAGFFKKNKGTKDFVFDRKGKVNRKRKRTELPCYKEPINVNQVSNVIHVLFGERPMPSLKEVAFGKIDYYFDKAMQSYLHINSYTRFNKNLNSDEYISEFMQTKKVVNNAWSTVDFVYWERIRKTLGDELFNELKSILSDLFEVSDITKKYTFMELREQVISRNMMNEGKLESFLNKLIKNKKTPLVVYFKYMNWEGVRKTLDGFYDEFKSLMSDLFEVSDITTKYSFMQLKEQIISRNMMDKGTKLDLFFNELKKSKKAFVDYFKSDSRKSEINQAPNIKVTVNMGTEKITKLSGDIIIPVTDEDIIKLNNHKGFATILDGGLVFIKGIFTENRLPNLETYRKVSDISVETY